MNPNLAVLIIAAVGAVIVTAIMIARKLLKITPEPVEQTPEEVAKEELSNLLTVETPPTGKKVEDEVGND